MKVATSLKVSDYADQYLLSWKILVVGELADATVEELTNKVMLLQSVSPDREITILLDSEGGDVYTSFHIFDLLTHLRCDVRVIVIGKAMSAAFVVALAGTRGKRLIMPTACMMQHEISSMAIGKMNEIESDLKECKRLEKLSYDIIKARTGAPKRLMARFRKEDVYLSAQESVSYGIMDGIATGL